MRNKRAAFSLLILAMALLLTAANATRAQQQSSQDAPPPKQIYVTGKVFAPQAIFFKQSITISQAIAMAGGMLPDAGRDRVRIYRSNIEKKTLTTMIVDLKAIEKRRLEDMLLQPYDIVEILSKESSKKLKRACPKPPCLTVEPRPKYILRPVL